MYHDVMNAFLLTLAVIMVIHPIIMLARLEDIHDAATQFDPKQLATIGGMVKSGITFGVIAMVMMLWM